MTRTALLLPLAIMGLSSPAFAADIDEVAASMLDGPQVETLDDLDTQSRSSRSSSSRSRGGKTITRSTGTNQRGQTKQRVTRSNGSKSQSTTRGRSQNQSTSHRRDGSGDWVSTRNHDTKTRSQTTRTNGTKTGTRSSGTNETKSNSRGVAGGERFKDQHGTRVTRTGGKLENGRGGVRSTGTKRVADRDRTKVNGRVVENSKRTTTTTRPTTQRGGSARPTAVRPGSTARPVPHARPHTGRPSHATVRPSGHAHGRPTTVVHTRPATRVVTYQHVRPYHGVFVYGPRPSSHTHYVDSSGPAQVSRSHMPERTLDRDKSFALGLKMGSLSSGYYEGGSYSDLGLGLAGRYRPAESVGLQLDVTHHAQSYTVNTERSQTLAAGSVQLFAFPWTRISPYAIGGVTYDARNINDAIGSDGVSATVIANDSLWGLHGGLGVEFALGQNIALDLEGRYIGYLDKSPNDPSAPGALQLTGGVMVHF